METASCTNLPMAAKIELAKIKPSRFTVYLQCPALFAAAYTCQAVQINQTRPLHHNHRKVHIDKVCVKAYISGTSAHSFIKHLLS